MLSQEVMIRAFLQKSDMTRCVLEDCSKVDLTLCYTQCQTSAVFARMRILQMIN